MVHIYNSRNYSILLNDNWVYTHFLSTTVEIILYYLTAFCIDFSVRIYNSRNYSILLNIAILPSVTLSTTVEIILYYLTWMSSDTPPESTTVEIILYYLTVPIVANLPNLQQ